MGRRRALPAGHWLCDQAYELVGGECEHAEHAVAHHLRGATNPDMATAELVLETTIDALTRRTLVVASSFTGSGRKIHVMG